ncbi:hypothetical protein ACLOAU_17885 [Niabella sp. CJ426]|uniref:hypothetical protein n=1 Tax=Niabella sp. CJ426 TaxID=3393740 RepID=UPI003D01161E
MVKNMLLVILLLVAYIADAQKQPGKTLQPAPLSVLQKIYLTTDKIIYTPNEQLWFAAYLFEHHLMVRDTADVLTLGLYDPVSDQMMTLKKFPIYNRIATGNILLPDSLIAGSYSLVAYTNILDTRNIPVGTGFKPLTIYARTGDKAFTTSLHILDSISADDKIAIRHEIVPESYQLTFKDARTRYQLPGEKWRTLDLDNYGKGVIYINSKDIKTANRSLSVITVYNGDTVRNRIRIPEKIRPKASLSASFYPEGGFLAPGYPNRVFWEVADKRTAASTRALLLENDQVIDTIETIANSASSFYVTAKAGRQYAVALDLPDSNHIKFPLPPVASDGLRFEIPDIVVNDSLTIELWSKEKRTVKLTMVDVTGLPSVHQLDINAYKKLTVLLEDFARGLCKVFITDEQNKVLARSYFFAHYKSRNQLHVETDRAIYKTRDSIALKVTIADKSGNPLNSIATISCALLSRIDFAMMKNVESDHDLGVVAYNEPSFLKRRNILDSSLLLEHVIRMKNMADDDTISTTANSLPEKFLKPGVQLKLARFGKREKKAMELVLFRESNFSFLKTNEEGILPLSNDELLVNDGRKIFVKGMGKKNGDYYVQTEDSLVMIHSNFEVPVYKPLYREQQPDLLALLKTDKTEKFSSTMETVIVRSKRDYGAMGRANPCGDYVCQYNILNCPNHIIPYKWPVRGQRYRTFGGELIYQGCDYENNMYLPSASLVYLPRTFLGMDTTLLKQEFPEYLSTLLWQPFKKLRKDGDNQLVFHTSDQKGVYLITVQGFAENGQPFYGEKMIRVED